MSISRASVNSLEFWCEDFGDTDADPVVLISGGTSQATNWPQPLIDGLTADGRRVIRFDNRDVGQSSSVDFDERPYSFSDMARDALGILDTFGLERADFIGVSMGGMICQTLAIEHRERVRSITSIMSTPGGVTVATGLATGRGPVNMPGPGEALLRHLAKYSEPPSSEAERIDRAVEMSRVIASTGEPFDEAAARLRHETESRRAKNIAAARNHGRALAISADRIALLPLITTPTLVVHGTDDVVLPLPHGRTTAALIPGAKLLVVEGMGHELPRFALATILDAILAHLRSRP